ncbi:restriction endonuclease subunit S [Corynebacterium rouxii]|uniref:Type I restriction modification DNA specificity domain-containing protein n=1 Tax=Corynebacterium rouxii TaxID=2719119 RepID=A0A6I8MIY0_9CORY|nr:restriction endonuclease subunit S [Corynebacterium rouxii]VZH86440.1 hypothetical protein FRC0190_02349 [Corynebacterium rouxii]
MVNSKKLGDVLTVLDSDRRPIKSNERIPGKTPYLGASGVVDFVEGRTHEGPLLCLAEDGENLQSRSLPVAWCQDGEFWANNHVHVLGGVSRNRLKFFEYAILNTDLSGYITGSAQPKLSQQAMRDISVPDFGFDEEERIGEFFGALDDKIAANQQVINAQDVLVQSLVRRENQAGVCIRLDDIAKSVSRGVAPKYTDDGSLVVNQRCIRNQAVDLTAARTLSNLPENKAKRLEPSDVLINSTGVGTLGRAARWIERIPDATADSHVSIVKFDERKVDPEFAGVVLTSMEKQIEDLAEGTTGQTELRRDLLSRLPLQLPRIKVQRQVGAQIRQFDASKRALEKENQVLAATRDELLPLLMNGKITVAEAKEAAGDVGVVKQNQQEEGDSSV